MIDIHSHVLPKIDDGPNSWEDTMAMVCQAEEDGIAEVAITHHILSNLAYEREEEIMLKYKELKERIAFQKLNIKNHLGVFSNSLFDHLIKMPYIQDNLNWKYRASDISGGEENFDYLQPKDHSNPR